MEPFCSRKTETLLLPTLFLTGIFSFLAPLAHAAGPIPVAITPTRIEFAAGPGQRLTGTIEFWNGTDDQLPVHLETADVAVQGEEGHAVVGGEEDATNSLKAWITPAIPDLVVFPKQKIKLDFAIDIPANADPGSHWGALLVRTAPVSSAGGAAVQVRVGTILLVDVYGEAKEKLTLESFSVPRFLEAPPVTLVARFQNAGTVHEKPVATIEVRNVFGQVVATSILPERNVIPRTIRRIEMKVGDGLWMGRYTALLRATYGSGTDEIVARAAFWVIPWRKYGLSSLIFFCGFVFIVVRRKQFAEASYILRTGKERKPEVSISAEAEGPKP